MMNDIERAIELSEDLTAIVVFPPEHPENQPHVAGIFRSRAVFTEDDVVDLDDDGSQ